MRVVILLVRFMLFMSWLLSQFDLSDPGAQNAPGFLFTLYWGNENYPQERRPEFLELYF